MSESESESDVRKLLAKPFGVGELKFFPVAVSKDKAQGKVGSYIDARSVMDRLDEVVGPDAWQTEYRVIDPETKTVECRLMVRLLDGWVTKADVGYPNEGKDADNPDKEPFKAAYSDALKRAAIQFGIGRYIYHLELERDWLPLDQYGHFTQQPTLKGAGRGTPPAQSTGQAQKTAPAGSGAPEEGKSTDQLGEFKSKLDPTLPDWTSFNAHVKDQGFSKEAMAKAAPPADPSKPGWSPNVWLRKHPDKTLMDLVGEVGACQREIEEQRAREPAPV